MAEAALAPRTESATINVSESIFMPGFLQQHSADNRS